MRAAPATSSSPGTPSTIGATTGSCRCRLRAVDHQSSVAAYLVPSSGGSPATLPVPPAGGTSSASLLGAGPNGVVWETSTDATTTLSLTDLTDPTVPVVRPLWTDLPSTLITS